MPNWCNNHITLRHENPGVIEAVVAAANKDEFFNTFVKRPEEKEEDWYSWNIENWGTKWEPSFWEEAVINDPNEVVLGFDTAWAPPIKFYEALVEQGFFVDAFYYEPGMNFCGRFADGCDEYIEIEGDSDWVDEFVPEEINECFAISENMRDWESE